MKKLKLNFYPIRENWFSKLNFIPTLFGIVLGSSMMNYMKNESVIGAMLAVLSFVVLISFIFNKYGKYE